MGVPAGEGPDTGLPVWAPDVTAVADYIPHRTLARVPVGVTGAEDQFQLTFDVTTRPTAEIVQRLLGDGVVYVTARVAPMNAASQSSAGVYAKLYAAAAVERGWPHDDSSLQRANDIEKRADELLAGLIASNDLANAGDGDPETVDAVLPYWSFPPADTRWDTQSVW